MSALREDVLGALTQHGELSTRGLLRVMRGQTQTICAALSELTQDGTVKRRPGPRRSWLYSVAREGPKETVPRPLETLQSVVRASAPTDDRQCLHMSPEGPCGAPRRSFGPSLKSCTPFTKLWSEGE